MKKVILSVCFIVITLSLSLPAFAADPFWNYTGAVNVKGSPMKAAVTLNYDDLGPPVVPHKTIKYYPASVNFNLTTDSTGAANTDISISGTVDGTNDSAFSLTEGMQGGALLVNHTYTVTASFNPSTEAEHPFSFADTANLLSMTGGELMTSTAEGTLVEIYKKGITNSAKINMTFKFVGKLDGSNDPALITVTLVGTVPEITP